MKYRALVFIVISIFLVVPVYSFAQVRYDGIVEFDTNEFDFGFIKEADGIVNCSVSLKNISQEPITVFNITSTCSCTVPFWSKDPLNPGDSTDIKVSFNPYGYSGQVTKPILLYITGIEKPIELSIKTRVVPLSIEEKYSIHFGPVFVSDTLINAGASHPGAQLIDKFTLANPSDQSISITYGDLPSVISILDYPDSLKSRQEADFVFSISADSMSLGYNSVQFSPIINGEPYPVRIDYHTVIDNASASLIEVREGPNPRLSPSTELFTGAVYGTPAIFNLSISNRGSQPLVIYKADALSDADIFLPGVITDWSCDTLGPGASGFVSITIDTSKFEPYEMASFQVVLTTNSPLKPQTSVKVRGYIDKY